MRRRSAANWLARLQSGRDPDIEHKFRRWRDSDPANAAAFESVQRSFEQAGLLRHSTLPSMSPPEPRQAASVRSPRYALAASVALALLVPAVLLLLGGGLAPFRATEAVMLTTNIGEVRQVKLSDGSRLTLDTDTGVEVEIGRARRKVRLDHGRARFDIVPASGPFVIDTKAATVSSDRGTVEVDRSGGQSLVVVLAGTADVRGSGDASDRLKLGAGDGVAAAPDGLVLQHQRRSAADWTRGMLQFDGTPLADAVAEANRYSKRKIILAGGLGQLRVTGAFRAGDAAGLAMALAAAFHLAVKRDSAGNLILSAQRG